ncbi:porin [Cellvibrio sp.]|uniref:porin n=1 Tax=Cellvibrio sp. TaxID=1965322 RepID=UPI003964784F
MSVQQKNSVARTAKFALKLLPFALGALVSSHASAGFPTLYGKVFLTANVYDFEKNNFALTAANATTYKHVGATGVSTELDSTAVESTGSRIGIQGDFGAANDLTVFYRIEYGIDVDNGANSNGRELTQRNVFGGVRGDWGQVLVGKNDTPLKTLQTTSVLRTDVDRFNDYPLADIGTYIAGENRPDNVIQYTSPILLGGLEINLAAIQAEETGVDATPAATTAVPKPTPNPQNDNGFATGKSLSVVYGKAKWYVGAAYESNVATADTLRLAGEYTFGTVKLGGFYQTSERHEDFDTIGGLTSTFVGSAGTTLGAQNGLNPLAEWDGAAGTAYKKQDAVIVNGQWKIAGPWTAKFQVGKATSTPSAAFKDVKTDAAAVGVDYALSDAARLFTYYARLKTKGDEAINTVASVDKTFAVGLDFKF